MVGHLYQLSHKGVSNGLCLISSPQCGIIFEGSAEHSGSYAAVNHQRGTEDILRAEHRTGRQVCCHIKQGTGSCTTHLTKIVEAYQRGKVGTQRGIALI